MAKLAVDTIITAVHAKPRQLHLIHPAGEMLVEPGSTPTDIFFTLSLDYFPQLVVDHDHLSSVRRKAIPANLIAPSWLLAPQMNLAGWQKMPSLTSLTS